MARQPRVRRDHLQGARASRSARRTGEDGPLYRPEIKIEYEADGALYRDPHYDIHRAYSSGRENAQAVLDRFALYDAAKDNRYPCWYDPADPGVCVLVRGYRWWVWLVFTVPLSFIVIGAGGLIYTVLRWGKSAERRAAMAQRAGERDLFGGGNGDRQYPFVPQGADMTNSPGTKLKFRLPMANSPGWALFGTLAFCVVLERRRARSLAVLARPAIWRASRTGCLTLFIVPFALIGLGAIAVFLRQLLVDHRHRADAGGNLRSSAVSGPALSRRSCRSRAG